jgi:hypothetical protein
MAPELPLEELNEVIDVMDLFVRVRSLVEIYDYH